jgi:hypothetical protein
MRPTGGVVIAILPAVGTVAVTSAPEMTVKLVAYTPPKMLGNLTPR